MKKKDQKQTEKGYQDKNLYGACSQGTPSESGGILQMLAQAKCADFYGAEGLTSIFSHCHLC